MSCTSLSRHTSVVPLRRCRNGYSIVPSGLGFRQSSFRLVAQVLRNHGFNAFSPSSAFPTCYFPLRLSVPGRLGNLWTVLSVHPACSGDTVITVTAHTRLRNLRPNAATRDEFLGTQRPGASIEREPPRFLSGVGDPVNPGDRLGLPYSTGYPAVQRFSRIRGYPPGKVFSRLLSVPRAHSPRGDAGSKKRSFSKTRMPTR